MDFEYLFTGNALIAALSGAFTTFLSIHGAGPMTGKWRHLVWIAATFLVALGWVQLAKTEAEKAKPDHDYVYLTIPDVRQQVVIDGKIQLWRISSGRLTEVKISFKKTADYDNPSIPAILLPQINFDENTEPFGLLLPIGEDYTFDIDPPSVLGKVREQIKLIPTASGVVPEIVLFRKRTLEYLIPQPRKTSPGERLVLICFVVIFMAFGGTLAWVSRTDG